MVVVNAWQRIVSIVWHHTKCTMLPDTAPPSTMNRTFCSTATHFIITRCVQYVQCKVHAGHRKVPMMHLLNCSLVLGWKAVVQKLWYYRTFTDFQSAHYHNFVAQIWWWCCRRLVWIRFVDDSAKIQEKKTGMSRYIHFKTSTRWMARQDWKFSGKKPEEKSLGTVVAN